MKRDVFLTILILLAMVLIPPRIGFVIKEHRITNVEGVVTTLRDICVYKTFQSEDEHYRRTDLREALYFDEVMGLSTDQWNALEVEKSTPLYIFDEDRDIFPFTQMSESRPVLYRFEVYEKEGRCYLKVYYLSANKKGEEKEYVGQYQFTNLSPDTVKALKEQES